MTSTSTALEKKDCGCGATSGELADKVCLKLGGIAGEETQQLCVVMTEDLKSGKITVGQWVRQLGDTLKEKNVSAEAVEKALTEAIAEVKRTPKA